MRTAHLKLRFLWIYPFIALTIFFLFNFNPHARVWLFLILTPFIHGVSNFKINFLIFYSLILCFTLLAKKGIRSERLIDLFKKINFLSVITAMIAGFLTFLDMTRNLKIPLDKYSYHFKDHFITINFFAHTHTTKLPMYYLAKLLHLDRFNEVYDTGLPLAGYVSPYLTFALSIFALIALFSFISLGFNTITKWDKPKQSLVFIIYAFASGHIIKSLIDGGMFSYDLLPSLIAIHLLFYSHSSESLSELFKKNALRYLTLLMIFVILGALFSRNDAILQTPIGSIFFISIFTLLFLPISGNTVFPRSFLKISVSILAFLYIALYFDLQAIRDIRGLMRKAQPGDRVLHYSYPLQSKGTFSPEVKDVSASMQNKKFADIYSELGENPFRNRNAAIISPKDSKAYGFIFLLKVLKSGEKVDLPPNPFLKIEMLKNLSKLSDKSFLLKATFNKDFFPSLWEMNPSTIGENNRFAAFFFLNHYFLNCGITEYVIVPYYFQLLP